MRERSLASLTALALAPLLLGAAPPGAFESPAPPAVAWSPGAGRDLVTTRCLFCHQAELIVAQRLTKPQWHKEVVKMVGWGAPLDAREQAVLAEYLAAHYGPEAPVSPPARLTLPAREPFSGGRRR
jgi:mono/diheme cytochrome c family protein